MRFLAPLFVFIAVAGFHSALSASLESVEKEEAATQQDGITKLQKIDQMEFEAAQKAEAAQMNVTEEQNEEGRFLEAVQDGSAVEEHVETGDDKSAEGGGDSDAVAHEATESGCESSEEADGRQRREHHEAKPETVSSEDETSQDSTKEQDVVE